MLSNVLYYCLFVTVLGFAFLVTLSLLGWAGILISIPVFFVIYLIFKGYIYKTSRPSDIEKMSLIATFVIDTAILACVTFLISRIFM